MGWSVTKALLLGLLVVQNSTYTAAAPGTETVADTTYRIDHPTPQLGKAR